MDSENDNDKVNMPSFSSSEPTVNYFDDFDYFKDFEKELPAIAYNDALTSKLDSSKPTVSPQHIDEFDETSLSESDDVTPPVILAEISILTHWTMMIKEGTGNEEEMRLNLDLLQERREKIAIRKAKCKMKIEHYYNKRVRPVSFKIGDYVYQKNKANRVENLGKLGLKWEGRYLVTEAYHNGSYKLQTMDDREAPHTWHAINLRRCYL
ncbi:hypothetical protein Tco_1192575 [Tanacetum coccineum]